MHDYTLIRSKRRSVSVSITPELQIVARCPARMPKRDVDAFISAHSDWIDRHMKLLRERAALKSAFNFADGQDIYFMGRAYPIEASEGLSGAELSGGVFRIGALCADRAAAFSAFLRRAAETHMAERIAFFSRVMGVSPSGIKITAAKTRWGSCSGKGGICFSLRLMCLPEHLIDYVAVHELAHLKQHNHSPRFYAGIAAVLPDYKARERELRDFQRKLPY